MSIPRSSSSGIDRQTTRVLDGWSAKVGHQAQHFTPLANDDTTPIAGGDHLEPSAPAGDRP
jgi:hypothetical protein